MVFPASILFKLPTDVITDLLCYWIEISELVQLDTSLCNRSNRPDYLEVLKQLPGISTISDEFSGNPEVNEWAVLRCIKVVALEVNESLFDDNGLKPKLDLSLVKHISFKLFLDHSESVIVHPLLAACPLLTSVEFEDLTLKHMDPMVLTRLESFEGHSIVVDETFVADIQRYCRHLLTFKMISRLSLTEIVRLNTHLVEIELHMTPSELVELLKICPAMKKITVYMQADTVFTSARLALVAKPYLTLLAVRSLTSDFSFVNRVGKKAVHITYSHADDDNMISLLSLIKGVNDLHLAVADKLSETIFLNWLKSCSSHTITKMSLKTVSSAFVQSAVTFLPNLMDLSWFSLESSYTFNLTMFSGLRYLVWNVWTDLSTVREILLASSHLVEGTMFLKLTDDEVEDWEEQIGEVLHHIARVDFTVLAGSRSAHSQSQFRYGALQEST